MNMVAQIARGPQWRLAGAEASTVEEVFKAALSLLVPFAPDFCTPKSATLIICEWLRKRC